MAEPYYATPPNDGDPDVGKRAKSSVNYSMGGDHCGVCRYFYGENEASEIGICRLVAGEIEEDYWCRLFERKRRR